MEEDLTSTLRKALHLSSLNLTVSSKEVLSVTTRKLRFKGVYRIQSLSSSKEYFLFAHPSLCPRVFLKSIFVDC